MLFRDKHPLAKATVTLKFCKQKNEISPKIRVQMFQA